MPDGAQKPCAGRTDGAQNNRKSNADMPWETAAFFCARGGKEMLWVQSGDVKGTRRGCKAVTPEPMNPYERRVLHYTLQNNDRVETVSEGEDPYRRVTVRLKKKKTDEE